jgi:hypothetical protein
MLMMCWFYCIPFAKGLFFATAPLLIVFSLFALKRGVRQSRPFLRQAAFLLIFASTLKIFTVDVYLAREKLLCDVFSFGCSSSGFKIFQALGLVLLAGASFGLLNLYRGFSRNRRQDKTTPEQVHLRFWANLSISLVMVLVFWVAAPWVGFLTIGHVPQLFMQVPWQNLAMMNIAVLLTGFWKLEDCNWIYQSIRHKPDRNRPDRVWTPKDTLWMSVILFLIALAFSYASNDVLSGR